MNTHALLEDLRTRGVTLEADGLTPARRRPART